MLPRTVLVALAALVLQGVQVTAKYQAPHHVAKGGHIIPNDYIVHFHEGHNMNKHQEAIGKDFSTQPDFIYYKHVPGYRAIMDEKTLNDLVRRDPGVKITEHNLERGIYKPLNVSEDFRFEKDPALEKRDYTEVYMTRVPYNIRIGGAGGKLEGLKPKEGGNYNYVKNAGVGAYAYILDTGITISHELFGGRAMNFHNWQKSPYTGESMDDVQGHGTHVAGIVGAVQFGQAMYATLVNVKVLNNQGRGNDAKISQAINDVVDQHNEYKQKNPTGYWRGSVINMSLGGPGFNIMMDNAVKRAYAAGIPVIAAAGNDNIDAHNQYPCSYQESMCVGSIDWNYEKSSFSNYGRNVHILAPGSDISSCSNQGSNLLRHMSGTSQATPEISGMMTIWISWEALNNNAGLLYERLAQNELKYLTTGFNSDTPNRLGTTGIKHPNKNYWRPYVGAPNRPARGNSINFVQEAYNIDAVNDAAQSVSPSSFPTFHFVATVTTTPDYSLQTQSGDPLVWGYITNSPASSSPPGGSATPVAHFPNIKDKRHPYWS